MNLKSTVSQNIKLLRKRNKLTQKDLANKLCYSEKAIAKWESGKSIPTIDTLYSISKIFGCSIDYLLETHNKIYFLGIDGGGTSTKYSLSDEQGNILTRYVGASSNPNDYGWEKTVEVLKNGIKNICANISYDSIVLYAGISGLRTCSNKDDIIKEISSLNFRQIYFRGDVDNALISGLENSDGIVAIIGTGISIMQRKNGRVNCFGGWGYLLDDGGSGYNVGLDALKYYFANLDGFHIDSALFDLIEKKSELKERELCSEIYKNGKKYIASFAKDVIELANDGDELAKEIIYTNVKKASNLILMATKSFEKNVKIALTGSVAESEIFNTAFKKVLHEHGYDNVSTIPISLSDGAVKLAMKLFNEKNNHIWG